MVPPKTWLAIPALALVAAGLALLAGLRIEVAIAIGALGAALAAAVRAFAGPSIASAVSASAASLLGVLCVLELPTPDPLRVALAAAAALFAIGELSRPLPADASPWPALGAAVVASALDPSFVLLLPVAGIRLVTGPWPVPRWGLAVPVVAALVVGAMVVTTVLRDGALAGLWQLWVARPASDRTVLDVLVVHGDLLGPVTAIVAVAGLWVCAQRGRIAASAALGALVGALALDLASRSPGPATLVVAALGAGSGIARFAGLVRWPAGQACIGGAVGFMLVVAPAWTLALG